MAMSNEQAAAFATGAGSTPEEVRVGIAAIAFVFLLLWLAWLAMELYQEWRKDEIELIELTWGLLRGGIMLMLLGWFIR